MPREMRVSVSIPLPEGTFAEADAIMKMRAPVEALTDQVKELNGTIECAVVTPKTRGEEKAA